MANFVSKYISTMDNQQEVSKDRKTLKSWLKKLGVAGFLFFLIKGLIWIGVFIWAGKCAMN